MELLGFCNEVTKMPRFEFTPNDYSPTYDIESDGDRGFVKLHGLYDLPSGWPERRPIDIEQHHIDYISGDGWIKVLAHKDWLKQET